MKTKIISSEQFIKGIEFERCASKKLQKELEKKLTEMHSLDYPDDLAYDDDGYEYEVEWTAKAIPTGNKMGD
jgi:hypothetical protein